MRPLRVILIYFLTVFVGGALLAPVLHGLVHGLAEIWPVFRGLAQTSFHRYVSRSLMVTALLLLWPFLRAMGIKSWKEVGVTVSGRSWKDFWLGAKVGWLSLALVALVALVMRERVWGPQPPKALLGYLLGAALTAMVVSVLEEVLFRGALFGALRRVHRWPVALLVSSCLFAIVHFFDQRPPVPETVEWSSGLVMLPYMIRGFGDIHALVPGFLNLALAGWILGYAFQRTGNLWLAIGLHAGWIFWLKSYVLFTREGISRHPWWWGTVRMIDGWFGLVVLLLVLLTVQRLTRRVEMKETHGVAEGDSRAD